MDGISVTPDLLTATNNLDHEQRGMIVGNRGFSSGVHYWEIKVTQCSWGSVCLGVCEKSKNYNRWGEYGFISYRTSISLGEEKLYGRFFNPGDIVGKSINTIFEGKK